MCTDLGPVSCVSQFSSHLSVRESSVALPCVVPIGTKPATVTRLPRFSSTSEEQRNSERGFICAHPQTLPAEKEICGSSTLTEARPHDKPKKSVRTVRVQRTSSTWFAREMLYCCPRNASTMTDRQQHHCFAGLAVKNERQRDRAPINRNRRAARQKWPKER